MPILSTSETRITIIGAGISGLAAAVLLRQKGYQHVRVFEKDGSFDARRQGYGLTILQGHHILRKMGLIEELDKVSVASRARYIFDPTGTLVGFFGAEFWLKNNYSLTKKMSLHVPRQELRRILYEKYMSLSKEGVYWGHELTFVSQEECIFNGDRHYPSDIVLGCDGYKGPTRSLIIKKEEQVPLKYLQIFIVLGITHCNHPLSKGRVFQTVNGLHRLFAMPFSNSNPKQQLMWQLSFPCTREQATRLSNKHALREQVKKICGGWHAPVPQMIENTLDELLMGIAAYDRDPILCNFLLPNVVLLGDAAHVMCPFKGQGANQALLDAADFVNACDRGGDSTQIIKAFHVRSMERVKGKVMLSRERVTLYHRPQYSQIESFLYPPISEEFIIKLRNEGIHAQTGDNIEKQIIAIMKANQLL